MEEKYEIFIQNSRIILRHGCILRFFGARYHPVGDSSPILDNHSSRITRSVHSRMDLFKEDMIFRLLSQFLAAPAGTLRGAVGVRHKPTVARSYSPPLESMQCRLQTAQKGAYSLAWPIF